VHPSRDSRRRRGGRARLPAPALALVRLASPSEFRGAARVARSWLCALPPRRSWRPRGFPLATWPPWPRSREILSWSSLPLQSRTASRLPVLRSRPQSLARPQASVQARDRLSWGSCSLEHFYAGCPFFAPPRPRGLDGVGESRQAFTGAVLRVPAPHDGSGCACGTHEPLAESAVSVRPDASRPCFMPLAPFGVALQSFPFSRSRTRSRGPPASLRVRVRPPNGAARSEVFATPFAYRADHSPRLALRLAGLEWPGRRFPGITRASRVARYRARVRRSFSDRAGLAGLGGRHARFEALLPSRVRSRDDPSLARDGGPPRSVLSWAIPL